VDVSWIASVFFAPVLAAKAEANFEASVPNEVPAAVKIAPLRPSSVGRNAGEAQLGGRGVERGAAERIAGYRVPRAEAGGREPGMVSPPL